MKLQNPCMESIISAWPTSDSLTTMHEKESAMHARIGRISYQIGHLLIYKECSNLLNLKHSISMLYTQYMHSIRHVIDIWMIYTNRLSVYLKHIQYTESESNMDQTLIIIKGEIARGTDKEIITVLYQSLHKGSWVIFFFFSTGRPYTGNNKLIYWTSRHKPQKLGE